MINADGMIGRLAEVVQDTDGSPRLDRPCHYRPLELVNPHHLGTGKGKYDATGLNLAEGQLVEAFVGHHGLVAGGEGFGEGGWVKDHYAIVRVAALEEVEHIGGEGGVGHLIGIIQLDIFQRPSDRPSRTVHGIDGTGSRPDGIDRKATRVAERIQHLLSLGIAAEELAIFPLIQK